MGNATIAEMKKLKDIINIAFGEITALFMSQKSKGTEIVMPTEELERISKETIKKLNI